MNISEKDLRQEIEYLDSIMVELDDQIRENKEKSKRKRSSIIAHRKDMWDELPHNVWDFDDAVDLAQEDMLAIQHEQDYFLTYKTIKRLLRMKESPYFGRIDFLEDGESQVEKIYIGISTLKDKKYNILIYDWRSPIAGMFYDFELGEAYYYCPDGTISGNISLKRQYKIVNGKFERIFDSDVKIDDDILQYILSESADSKMKTIVSTIQREQNKAIRDEMHKLLIVQGSAGSGKTSIALHRIAYLLYRYRNSISSNNIAIFSPNLLFKDYISDVIPELGEDNVYQTTFREYAQKMLSRRFSPEDLGDQIEYLLTSPDIRDRIIAIRFKASVIFLKLLKRYATYLEREGFSFKGFEHNGKLIISQVEINDLFYNSYRKHKVIRRLFKLREHIYERLNEYKKTRRAEVVEELRTENSDSTEKELKAMARLKVMRELRYLYYQLDECTTLDVEELYYGLFNDKDLMKKLTSNQEIEEYFDSVIECTLQSYKSYKILYEDIGPIILLKNLMGYRFNTSQIKHVLIDEAQDYTPVQFEVFRQLFPNTPFTILGDVNQRISLYAGIKKYDTVLDIFRYEDNAIINLKKSYRSTVEIFDLCNKLLSDPCDSEHIGRHGEPPLLIGMPDEEKLVEAIALDIDYLKNSGMKSIAVICKTAVEAERAYKALSKRTRVNLITKDTSAFNLGVSVIPSYLAKGLEFDAVIAYNISDRNYHKESHRGLLYVTLSRALHKLHIYYIGKLSRFLGDTAGLTRTGK